MWLDGSLQCDVGGSDRDLTVCLLVAFRMLLGNLSLLLEASQLLVYLLFCNNLSALRWFQIRIRLVLAGRTCQP